MSGFYAFAVLLTSSMATGDGLSVLWAALRRWFRRSPGRHRPDQVTRGIRVRRWEYRAPRRWWQRRGRPL